MTRVLSISSATDDDYCSALSNLSPDYMSMRSFNSCELPILELTAPTSPPLTSPATHQSESTPAPSASASSSSSHPRQIRLTVNCFEKAQSVDSGSDGPATTPTPSVNHLGPMYLPEPNKLFGAVSPTQQPATGMGSSMLSRAATIRKHLSFRLMHFTRDPSSETQQSTESQGSSGDRDDEIAQLRARWVSTRAATCPFVIGTKDFDNYQQFVKSDKKRRHFDFDPLP
uniref:Uncharacterized protein n=1 Tax=Plectus sambesii TaxID=2011161 RepID=A0A914WDE7_9BILA